MHGHFLQSETWRDFQKELGREIVEGSGKGWSYFGLVEHDRFGKYIYVPYGPSAENSTAFKAAIKDLESKGRQVGAYVVNVEPTAPITKAIAAKYLQHKGKHRQAHRTLVIDLSVSEDDVLAQMNKTRRKQYRNYDKKGIAIEKSNTPETLDKFYELLKISSGDKGFYIRGFSFFKAIFDSLVPAGNASLFTATRDGQVEVAAMIYDDEDTRYYAHVGRDLGDNSLQASAPLITYMIIDAKRSGKKFFDLYGISESDDKVDEKSGFTVFKKTFGGEIVEFGGAWEIPINSVKYKMSRLLRSLKSIKSRRV